MIKQCFVNCQKNLVRLYRTDYYFPFKKLLFIPILLQSLFSFGQIKAKIIDSQTKEKIPYVNIWVENENIGTTSNEKGEFTLDYEGPKTIIFSAIGFQSKKINSDSINDFVQLIPTTTDLEEVVIQSTRKTQELTIGAFKKSKINSYFSCGTKPWIAARFFEYKKEYDKTPFLKRIKVLTDSEVKDSKFNIRLYQINENGEPEGYIYKENIFGIAKKGKNLTEIDLSDLQIKFPTEGFFIAVEWLIIEANKFEYKYTREGSKKKLGGVSYEPSIGLLPTEINANSWLYLEGKWMKDWIKNPPKDFKRYRGKYNMLAIELTLSN